MLHTLFLKSLRYVFFLWSFWTQYTSNFLSCINLQNNQTAERLTNIRIRKFQHEIFSNPFTVTSFETRRENKFFKSKFELHNKKPSRGSKNFFDLDEFSNYRSLNYMTSTVFSSGCQGARSIRTAADFQRKSSRSCHNKCNHRCRQKSPFQRPPQWHNNKNK